VTFLVDANVVLYSAVDSKYRSACEAILAGVMEGRMDGKMSPAILEEVWHLELSGRIGAISGLTAAAFRLFRPLLVVTDGVIERALALGVSGLGANDRIHAATAMHYGIQTILTADAGFEAVPGIRRVDPLDAAARSRLAGS